MSSNRSETESEVVLPVIDTKTKEFTLKLNRAQHKVLTTVIDNRITELINMFAKVITIDPARLKELLNKDIKFLSDAHDAFDWPRENESEY